jgi:hypothetical protein
MAHDCARLAQMAASGPPASAADEDRGHRPHRLSPTARTHRPPARGLACAVPAAAWSQTSPHGERLPPDGARHCSPNSVGGRFHGRWRSGPWDWHWPQTHRFGPFNATRRAKVLPLHRNRLRVFFQNAGLIKHQDRLRLVQVLTDMGPQAITYHIDVPLIRGQQPLHLVRRRISGLFCQLPAIPSVPQSSADL